MINWNRQTYINNDFNSLSKFFFISILVQAQGKINQELPNNDNEANNPFPTNSALLSDIKNKNSNNVELTNIDRFVTNRDANKSSSELMKALHVERNTSKSKRVNIN